MKNLYNTYSFKSNPSVLGADKLWNDFDVIGRDNKSNLEYDGV